MRAIINHIEEVLMSVLLAFMTLLTFTQVVLRYLFNSGWVWSLEATTYSFAALVLIGISYGVRTKTHIAVDLLTKKIPSKIRIYVTLFAVVICLIYTALMFYGAYELVDRLQTLGNMARDVPAPKWLLTAVMPLGFLLLGYRFIEAGIKAVKGDLEVLVPGGHDKEEQGDK